MLAALALDEGQLLQELPVLLAQSRDYASAGDAANALAVNVISPQQISTQHTDIVRRQVAQAVTGPFVAACPTEDSEDLQGFFREMEETWDAIVEVRWPASCANQHTELTCSSANAG